MLVTTWRHSSFRFAMAFQTERMECVLTGLVQVFEFFACVPKELWWDNPKTVVKHIFKGRSRQMHPRYAALASQSQREALRGKQYLRPAEGLGDTGSKGKRIRGTECVSASMLSEEARPPCNRQDRDYRRVFPAG